MCMHHSTFEISCSLMNRAFPPPSTHKVLFGRQSKSYELHGDIITTRTRQKKPVTSATRQATRWPFEHTTRMLSSTHHLSRHVEFRFFFLNQVHCASGWDHVCFQRGG